MAASIDLPPPWPPGVLARCADVLGDTEHGLTGREIGELLSRLRMSDPHPELSKSRRLAAAFEAHQAATLTPRRVVTFIVYAMEPARYVDRPELFTLRQDRLNQVLTFVGLRVNDAGRIAKGAASATLSEAARHASTVVTELRRRNTHTQVLAYCTVELLSKNNFHACLEATKSVFTRIRELTAIDADGETLANATVQLGKDRRPRLAINSLATETEESEQKGFHKLLCGIANLYRNPVAHDPRLQRTISDEELLELMATLSMLHRRLDTATVIA